MVKLSNDVTSNLTVQKELLKKISIMDHGFKLELGGALDPGASFVPS